MELRHRPAQAQRPDRTIIGCRNRSFLEVVGHCRWQEKAILQVPIKGRIIERTEFGYFDVSDAKPNLSRFCEQLWRETHLATRAFHGDQINHDPVTGAGGPGEHGPM
jgi:hypothetical protein